MSSDPEEPRALSFRDPSGRLISVGGRLIRVVVTEGAADLLAFLALDSAAQQLGAKRIVSTRVLEGTEAEGVCSPAQLSAVVDGMDACLLLEHERVPFASFPYEWPAEMLQAAGALTLDLAEELLEAGFGLKDATPYNVLFRGPEPIFVDVLSFERRQNGDQTWLPYAQFLRTFLMPLLVNRYFGISPSQTLVTRRDGLEPEEVYDLCGRLRRLRPPFLTLVSLPTWLGARNGAGGEVARLGTTGDTERARFILERLFKNLRRHLVRLGRRGDRKSAWSDYMTSAGNDIAKHIAAKEDFVRWSLDACHPRRVLDVGCNTGHFSEIVAKTGASVVAIDYDPVVVGELWSRARAQGMDILPLVVDLTRPSPAIGWRNQECPAFLDRAREAFDFVLMLAVVHHMLVSERVPLEEIIDLAATLTSDFLLIEFIAADDAMFRRLARGREALFTDLTRERFEATCRRRFVIVKTQQVGTSRRLYLLRKGHSDAAP